MHDSGSVFVFMQITFAGCFSISLIYSSETRTTRTSWYYCVVRIHNRSIFPFSEGSSIQHEKLQKRDNTNRGWVGCSVFPRDNPTSPNTRQKTLHCTLSFPLQINTFAIPVSLFGTTHAAYGTSEAKRKLHKQSHDTKHKTKREQQYQVDDDEILLLCFCPNLATIQRVIAPRINVQCCD